MRILKEDLQRRVRGSRKLLSRKLFAFIFSNRYIGTGEHLLSKAPHGNLPKRHGTRCPTTVCGGGEKTWSCCRMQGCRWLAEHLIETEKLVSLRHATSKTACQRTATTYPAARAPLKTCRSAVNVFRGCLSTAASVRVARETPLVRHLTIKSSKGADRCQSRRSAGNSFVG